MKISFEYSMNLLSENKVLHKRIHALESGAAYVRLQEECAKKCREKDREIRKLKTALEEARRQIRQNRDHWFQVYEDLEKEKKTLLEKKEQEILKLQKTCQKAEQDCGQMRAKYLEQLHMRYDAETALEEEKGKNVKLRAQINRDYENSSIPSSKSVRRKKISNSREKTGRTPGGQPGHKGHCRKKQEPTQPPFFLPPPEEVLKDPGFKKTSKTIVKQLVSIRMLLDVKEYHADVYYNSQTGEYIHAAFPEGVKDEVNYDGSIRAFLFLLNNDCCTSIDRSRKFLSDLTGGKLKISKGMVSKLGREFAEKTEEERRKVFADLLLAPVLHTDCTNARADGKNCYVYVCASPDGKSLYFARKKKGYEGVKDTVAEDYQGILVHDHDITFYHYGTGHQECLAHVLRYLKDSMENEPERTWNREMHSLVQEMIHYRNGKDPCAELEPEKVAGFEEKYLKILETAQKEYEDIPPGKYYKDGYNLYRRMKTYMQNHLLFLHDTRVPATNNEAERLLRNYKRKQAQAVTFRSFESIDSLCQCMSMLALMRLEESENIFDRVSQIFG